MYHGVLFFNYLICYTVTTYIITWGNHENYKSEMSESREKLIFRKYKVSHFSYPKKEE